MSNNILSFKHMHFISDFVSVILRTTYVACECSEAWHLVLLFILI